MYGEEEMSDQGKVVRRKYTKMERRIADNPKFAVTADYICGNSGEGGSADITQLFIAVTHWDRDGRPRCRLSDDFGTVVIHGDECDPFEGLGHFQRSDLLDSIQSGRPAAFQLLDFGKVVADGELLAGERLGRVAFEFESMVSPKVRYRYDVHLDCDSDWTPVCEPAQGALPKVVYGKHAGGRP